ncbi:hypothetical protein TeGR_g10337 [Tetraparma gracilis]|uniref:VWFA domain-containing protein n=1 Tax=Tetraparma gracilis TaxID=2962635 RepID=A0ABQ6MI69_9STRA|nr:hypothetical protein TeGR_g10337 [Tetraparma gracilis]
MGAGAGPAVRGELVFMVGALPRPRPGSRDRSPLIFVVDLSGSMGEHSTKLFEACAHICADAVGTEGLVHIVLFGGFAKRFDAGAPDAVEQMKTHFDRMMGGTIYQSALEQVVAILDVDKASRAGATKPHLLFMTDGADNSYGDSWRQYFDLLVRDRVTTTAWYLRTAWGNPEEAFQKLHGMCTSPLDLAKMAAADNVASAAADAAAAAAAAVRHTRTVPTPPKTAGDVLIELAAVVGGAHLGAKYLVELQFGEKTRTVPGVLAPDGDTLIVELLMPLGEEPPVRLQVLDVRRVGEETAAAAVAAAAADAPTFEPCEAAVAVSHEAPSVPALIVAAIAEPDGLTQLEEATRCLRRMLGAADDSRRDGTMAALESVARRMRTGDPNLTDRVSRLLKAAEAMIVRAGTTGRATRRATKALQAVERALKSAQGEEGAAIARRIADETDRLRAARLETPAYAYGEDAVSLENLEEIESGNLPLVALTTPATANRGSRGSGGAAALEVGLVNPEQTRVQPFALTTSEALAMLQDYRLPIIHAQEHVAIPLFALRDPALARFMRAHIIASLALLGQPGLPLGRMEDQFFHTSLVRPNFDKSEHWTLLPYGVAFLDHVRVEIAPSVHVEVADGRLLTLRNGGAAGQLPSRGTVRLAGGLEKIPFTNGGTLGSGGRPTLTLARCPTHDVAGTRVQILPSEQTATLLDALGEIADADHRVPIMAIVQEYLAGGSLHGVLAAAGAPPLPGLPCQIWESIWSSVFLALLMRRLDGASAAAVRDDYEALRGYIKLHAARRALKGAVPALKTELLAIVAADPALGVLAAAPIADAALDALYAALGDAGDAAALLKSHVDPGEQRLRAGAVLAPATLQELSDALVRTMQPRAGTVVDPHRIELCPPAEKVAELHDQGAHVLALEEEVLRDISNHLCTAPKNVCDAMARAGAVNGAGCWRREALALTGLAPNGWDGSGPIPPAVLRQVPLPAGAAAAAAAQSAEVLRVLRRRAIAAGDPAHLAAAVRLTRELHPTWSLSQMLAMLRNVRAAAGGSSALLHALWPTLPWDEALNAVFLEEEIVSVEEVESKRGKPGTVPPTPGSRAFQRLGGAPGLGLGTRTFQALTPLSLLCALHHGCEVDYLRKIAYLLTHGGGRLMAVVSRDGHWAVLTLGGHVPRWCSTFYVANRPEPEAPLPLYPGVLADGSGLGGYTDNTAGDDGGFADLIELDGATARPVVFGGLMLAASVSGMMSAVVSLLLGASSYKWW